MRADGSPPVNLPTERLIGRAGLLGLAALLFASCSTTVDPFTQLGLAPQALQPQPVQTVQSGSAEQTGNLFVAAEGDPELPDQVTVHPKPANGGEPYIASPVVTAQLPVAQSAAAAPAVDDAVLAARMGSNGAYLETVTPQLPSAAMPAPAASQKRRGLFASLFGRDDPQQQTAPVAQVPAAAPVETQIAAAQPTAEYQLASGPEEATQPSPDIVVASASEPVVQPTAYVENRAPQAAPQITRQPERKRGFLSSFFGNAEAAPVIQPTRPAPQVQIAAVQPRSTASAGGVYGGSALPGVRSDNLFEIKRKSGLDDDSDIDINEGDEDVQVAMAPGLARLAPNGLLKQTDKVDVTCLKPSLVRVLKTLEGHYGRSVVVTSGYRSPPHNARARGARNSLHMFCAAADIQVDGIGKWELAQYMRSMPGRGGVGTYCHTNSVHIDVGPERDWNWRCRRRKKK